MTPEEAAEKVEIRYFTKQGLKIRGVVHVGANNGYEIEFYLAMGAEKILAFEPLDSAFTELLKKYSNEPRVTLMQCALGDFPAEALLNVTSGDGMGSSFLREYAGPYIFIGQQSCPIVRFDSLDVDMSPFNTLVVDTQGMEMQVLRGFGEKLKEFEFLNIECSRSALYEGGYAAQEVIDFLAEQGFQQETPIQDHNDIMFRRKQC